MKSSRAVLLGGLSLALAVAPLSSIAFSCGPISSAVFVEQMQKPAVFARVVVLERNSSRMPAGEEWPASSRNPSAIMKVLTATRGVEVGEQIEFLGGPQYGNVGGLRTVREMEVGSEWVLAATPRGIDPKTGRKLFSLRVCFGLYAVRDGTVSEPQWVKDVPAMPVGEFFAKFGGKPE